MSFPFRPLDASNLVRKPAPRPRRRHQSVGKLEMLEARTLLSSTKLITYTTAAQFNQGRYTVSEDFEKGVLFNLNAQEVADQLQLNARLTTFPVMWIANSGDPSISKWDTSTNKESARYFTHFAPSGQPGFNGPYGSHFGPAPSRTAVDRDGNVFVANRHFDNRPAAVMKILAEGGIDRNGNGVIDTSSDLNGDGNIGNASFQYDDGEILPLADLNSNGKIDPEEITDERIAWVVQVGPVGGLGRSLAIDPDGNIWLGLYQAQTYYKLSGDTGEILAGPIDVSALGHTPYGAQIDGNGILWGASLGNTLLRLNTKTHEVKVYDHSAFGGDYGITIANGKVYQATYSGNTYIEFDPVTETFSTPAAVKFSSLGIASDRDGNIVSGRSSGGVVKFRPDGSVIWNAPAQSGLNEVRGTVVDSNNDVWLIHLNTGNLSKYSGEDGSPLGVFTTGNAPYTYTDATGLTRFTSTNPSGRWSVIQDAGVEGANWPRIFWNTEPEASVPEGTSIVVEARAADTQEALAGLGFQPVTNHGDLNLTGRFIEVRVTLNASSNLVSPVLSDLTIATEGGAPQVAALSQVVQGPRTRVILSFTQPLDSASAQDLGNFRIVCRGADGRFNTRDDNVFGLRRAVYNAETGTISLILRHRLPAHRTYQITVNGDEETGVRGANGLLLDGAGTGNPGSDFVTTFRHPDRNNGNTTRVGQKANTKKAVKTPVAKPAAPDGLIAQAIRPKVRIKKAR